MREALTCLLFLTGSAIAPRVHAADLIGVLPVAPAPGPSLELVEATSQLRQAMAVHDPAAVVDARQLRDRMAGQPAGASLDELDRAFEGARAAALGGDYEGSAKTLGAIVEELGKLPDGEAVFRQWTRAMLRLAKTEQDLGHGDAARGILERLARAAPDVRADPGLYPPRFAKQLEEVRAQLRALPTHALRVTTPGTPARVYVDGRDVGLTPVALSLPAGSYRVSGVADDVHAPARRIDLGADEQAISLDFTVPEALRPALPGLALPESQRADRLISAGAYLGLASLLATTLIEERGATYLLGSLYDVRRGMLKREARVRLAGKTLPAGATMPLAEFLLTGEVTSNLVEIAGRGLEPRPGGMGGPRAELPLRDTGAPMSKTLGWTAVSTGVAAITLGGVALWQSLSSQGAYSDARKMLDTNGTLPPGQDPGAYNAKVRSGDDAHRLSVITGIGAGACAVTTGILGYLAYKQTGEVGPFRF